MTRIWSSLAFTALALPVFAFQPTTGERNFSKQIDALLAMPKKERKAQVRKLDAAERRGLWHQLKKEAFLRLFCY